MDDNLQRILQPAIELYPIACLLLAQDQTICVINSRARKLIAEHPALDIQENRLVISAQNVAALLSTAIRECLSHGNDDDGMSPKSFLTLPRGRGSPIITWAVPFRTAIPPTLAKGVELVALFFHDPEYKIPLSETWLREHYGMTRAEVKVAMLIATGHAVDEIAETTGTTVNAVRFHLKAIYAKTGTHRQSELVARILPSAVLGCHGHR
jgi:DNA-binding CsgD family transcriptional regulator